MSTIADDLLIFRAGEWERHGLVLLVGAGVSIPPPTSLPGWRDFNNAVLSALARRVDRFTGGDFPAEETMVGLRTLRDERGALPPDFQAQLMEEECGPEYFRVLQVLDTDVRNACHDAIAALARTGVIKAIVTTNFDRLIERALEAAGITPRVFATIDEFENLSASIDDAGALALIKPHGTVQSPDSMVDTLRQRVRGRPEALEQTLTELFARHACLVVGFSGADLAYDPDYLGLKAGAVRSPSFTVLNRTGTTPLPAMQSLVDACPNGRLVDGVLPDSLVALAAARGATVAIASANAQDSKAARLAALDVGIEAWVEPLGDLAAVNILSGILESATTRASFKVLTSARRQMQHASDRGGSSYWRFQVNFGRHLLERGYIGQDLPFKETYEAIDRGELDEIEPDDAFTCLLRAEIRGHRWDGSAYVARALAYRGECDLALEMTKAFRKLAVESKSQLLMLDSFISAATVHAVVGNWSGGLEFLESIYPVLQHIGDEPRRARLCAHLGKFLAWAERYEDAERYLTEGLKIADQLKLGLISAELHAAWGYLELDRGQPAEAVPHLFHACSTFGRAELISPLVPALLDLAEAAFRVDKNDLAMDALGKAEAELDRYPGYLPHYFQRVARMACLAEKFDQARDFTTKMRAAGQATRNDWAIKSADTLDGIISRAEARFTNLNVAELEEAP